MPSLHIAHELVMLYFARSSKLAFPVSLAFTALTTVAVVALGWHYPSDLVAGAVLAVFAIALARWQSDRLLPRWFGKSAG
jgi:membrane-associated phospholipid phosphatase